MDLCTYLNEILGLFLPNITLVFLIYNRPKPAQKSRNLTFFVWAPPKNVLSVRSTPTPEWRFAPTEMVFYDNTATKRTSNISKIRSPLLPISTNGLSKSGLLIKKPTMDLSIYSNGKSGKIPFPQNPLSCLPNS